MALQRQLTATGDDSDRLHVDPAACYTMTGTLRATKLAPGKAKTAAWLTPGLLPIWTVHRVYAKNISHPTRPVVGNDTVHCQGRCVTRTRIRVEPIRSNGSR